MSIQRRTQIVILICIAILIMSAAVLGYRTINPNNLPKTVSDAGQHNNPLELTDHSVSSAINGTAFLVLDFYYPGCGPCKFMNKTVMELSNELQGQIEFGRINVKANSITAMKYKVTSYPTLLFFDEGILVNRMKGNMSKSDLLADLIEFRLELDTTKVQLKPSVAAAPSGTIPLATFGTNKSSRPMLLNDDDLDQATRKYPYLVVDAYAYWCDACHRLNGTLSELSSELQGQVAFGMIDVEKNNATKTEYNVTSYPTLLIYKNGKLADRLIGNRAKSVFVSELKGHYPKLDTSMVKMVQPASQPPAKPKLTAEQACMNITKSDRPLLEAFVVSRCPFGLQMQRIMAEMVNKSPQSEDYLKVRYIGSIINNNITSMHGAEEAQENLRQICIREEQPAKYWDYVSCYIREGKSANCLNSSSIDKGRLSACIKDTGRGLAYAQKDFDLANKFNITGSPTLTLNGRVVSESDFASDITSSRSPEALKELVCCSFNTRPSFCAQELNKTRAITMFSVQTKTEAQASHQSPGRDIPLASLGLKNPNQAMLITDDTMSSALSQYRLLVVEGYVDWSGFCKSMNVTLSDLARELQG